MAKIKRPSPPEHIVLVDTNILWHEDKEHVVNPAFDEFWKSYSSNFPMKLIIPDVVKGELLFQQTTSVIKLLGKANSNIRDITKITGVEYSHRIQVDRVRKEVAKRFERWLQSKKAKIWSTPIKDIDWDRVINDALWRKLPFTPDPENPKNEKGFRDAMILETVHAICKYYSEEVNIAFICNDFTLREVADDRLGKIEGFSTYESLEDFVAFIELTKRNLTERFVKSILSRARDKFHNEKGQKCLIYSDDFIKKLREEFKSKIETPVDLVGALSLFSQIPGSTQKWNHISTEQVWVTRPLFKKVEEDNIYHWTSKITFVRQYERELGNLADISGTKERRLLILSIDVHWQASVRNDGRFFRCTIVDYKESDYLFKVPTPEELERYGIQKKVEQTTPADDKG